MSPDREKAIIEAFIEAGRKGDEDELWSDLRQAVWNIANYWCNATPDEVDRVLGRVLQALEHCAEPVRSPIDRMRAQRRTHLSVVK